MGLDSPRAPGKPFAYALIAAPLLFIVSDLLTSGIWDDNQRTFLANVAENEARHLAGNLVGVLGAVCLVAAIAGIAMLVTTARRRLGTIAGGIALFGVIFLPGMWLFGTAVESVAATDSDRVVLGAFFERSEDSGTLGFTWFVPFLMMMVGSIALAVGLFIGRVVPRWIPVALVVGLVATFFADGTATTVAAGVVMLAALGGIGFTILNAPRGAAAAPRPVDRTAPAAT